MWLLRKIYKLLSWGNTFWRIDDNDSTPKKREEKGYNYSKGSLRRFPVKILGAHKFPSFGVEHIVPSFEFFHCFPGTIFIRFKLNICFFPRFLPTSGQGPSPQVAHCLVSEVIEGDCFNEHISQKEWYQDGEPRGFHVTWFQNCLLCKLALDGNDPPQPVDHE